MNKEQFVANFREAVAKSLKPTRGRPRESDAEPEVLFDFVIEELENGAESAKFIGGRILTKSTASCVPFHDAVKYLWIDGRVPEWINLHALSEVDGIPHIQVYTSARLAPADGPWRHVRSGTPPFHVLIPSE